MTGESQKVTYQISATVVEEVREAVDSGYAPSMSRFVEDALRARLRELREERVRQSCMQAAQDRLVAEDVAEIESAFGVVDSDDIPSG